MWLNMRAQLFSAVNNNTLIIINVIIAETQTAIIPGLYFRVWPRCHFSLRSIGKLSYCVF